MLGRKKLLTSTTSTDELRDLVFHARPIIKLVCISIRFYFARMGSMKRSEDRAARRSRYDEPTTVIDDKSTCSITVDIERQ